MVQKLEFKVRKKAKFQSFLLKWTSGRFLW